MRAAFTVILSACLAYVTASGQSKPVECATCPDSVTENGKEYDLIFSDAGAPDVNIFCGYVSLTIYEGEREAKKIISYATKASTDQAPDQEYCAYYVSPPIQHP